MESNLCYLNDLAGGELGAKTAIEFLHRVADNVCGRPANLLAFAQPPHSSLNETSISLLGDALSELLRKCMKYNYGAEEEKEDLVGGGGGGGGEGGKDDQTAGKKARVDTMAAKAFQGAGVTPELIPLLTSAIHVRLFEISSAMQRVTSALSIGRLEEFNWSIRVVLASDTIGAMRRPLLWLHLSIRRPSGILEERQLELPLDAMTKLTEALDAAHEIAQGTRST